jgi:hypothetical protein
VTSGASLRCRGNWSADLAFAPTSGTVTLEGSGTTAIASTAPGSVLRFHNLSITNGVRAAATDVVLEATSVVVAAGSRLRTNGRTVAVPAAATTVTVRGTLEADAGGSLLLGKNVAPDISAGGTLRVVGTTSLPARVGGWQGGGYRLAIASRLEALNFLFEEMGPAGIQILASASLGALPEDLRAGTFAAGDAAVGSVLLDLARSAPVDLHRISFLNVPPRAAFNVRSRSSARIRFVNWTGAFGGPPFEDDPNNVIDWIR